jgi:hypothetical protein
VCWQHIRNARTSARLSRASSSLGKARACTHYLACKGRVKPQPAHCCGNGLAQVRGDQGEAETSRWRAASSATSMRLGAGMDSGGFEMPFSSSKKCLQGFTLSNFALLRSQRKILQHPLSSAQYRKVQPGTGADAEAYYTTSSLVHRITNFVFAARLLFVYAVILFISAVILIISAVIRFISASTLFISAVILFISAYSPE